MNSLIKFIHLQSVSCFPVGAPDRSNEKRSMKCNCEKHKERITAGIACVVGAWRKKGARGRHARSFLSPRASPSRTPFFLACNFQAPVTQATAGENVNSLHIVVWKSMLDKRLKQRAEFFVLVHWKAKKNLAPASKSWKRYLHNGIYSYCLWMFNIKTLK